MLEKYYKRFIFVTESKINEKIHLDADTITQMLWQLYAEKEELLTENRFSLLEPFLMGIGGATLPLTGTNFAFDNLFRDYVCERLGVFNFIKLERDMTSSTLSGEVKELTLYQMQLERIKNGRKMSNNWLDFIKEGRNDNEAFLYFFTLLKDFRPKMIGHTLHIAKKKPLRENEENLYAFLAYFKGREIQIVGAVDPISFKQFLKGYMWATWILTGHPLAFEMEYNCFLKRKGYMTEGSLFDYYIKMGLHKSRVMFYRQLEEFLEEKKDCNRC